MLSNRWVYTRGLTEVLGVEYEPSPETRVHFLLRSFFSCVRIVFLSSTDEKIRVRLV